MHTQFSRLTSALATAFLMGLYIGITYAIHHIVQVVSASTDITNVGIDQAVITMLSVNTIVIGAYGVVIWRRPQWIPTWAHTRRTSHHSAVRTWSVIALVMAWLSGQTLALRIQTNANTSETALSPSWVLAHITMAVLIAPLAEEILMRRIAYSTLRNGGFSVATSAMISALVFALLHGNLAQISYAFGMGIVLAFIYEGTHQLRWTVIAHMAFNIASLVIPAWVIEPLSQNIVVIAILITASTMATVMLWGCVNTTRSTNPTPTTHSR